MSGLAWRRYYNRRVDNYGLNQEEIFGACAAAAMYRRDVFLKVGGFDEDYFAYFEDVDLSFRLRLLGDRCLYVPTAVVRHVGSSSTGKLSDFVVYYGHRNLVWTYVKNMPTLLFWLCLPLHIMLNLYFLMFFSLKGKKQAILKAKWDALHGISNMLRKRMEIQRARTVSFGDIYRQINKGMFEPFSEALYRMERR
jgi:GT2 family glycosyltransferase